MLRITREHRPLFREYFVLYNENADTFTLFFFFFFLNDPAPPEFHPLPPPAALPISVPVPLLGGGDGGAAQLQRGRHLRRLVPHGAGVQLPQRLRRAGRRAERPRRRQRLRHLERRDRKSTRLNSSHSQISYAVFCLKK